MTPEDFDAALSELGWKYIDFCRMAGLHRNTPGQWRKRETDIPLWVDKFLGMALEVKRLHDTYVLPKRDRSEKDPDA